MRSAINKAYTLQGVQAFVGDLGDASCVNCEEAVGSDMGTVVRVWFRRFCTVKGYLAPSIVPPIRDYFFRYSGQTSSSDRVAGHPGARVSVTGNRFSRGPEGVQRRRPGGFGQGARQR